VVATALGLVRATHPLPAASVTALVGLVTAARGAGAVTTAWVVLSTLAGQASVGWSNDYLDRHRDRAAGRTDKPLVGGDVSPGAVLAGAVIAFPASAVLSLPVGLPEAGVMAVAVASAWGYNLGLKATVMSWVPYAVSFGLAPLYIWLATSAGDLAPPWLVAGTAVLGVSAHLLNVIPDLEGDRRTSVRGLPHHLGLKRSLFLACVLLAAVLMLILGAGGVSGGSLIAAAVAVVLIAVVALTGLRGWGRLGFRLGMAAAGAVVLAFLLSPSGPRW
jgi:4-hydroxybenzoate polyprenyltransferase